MATRRDEYERAVGNLQQWGGTRLVSLEDGAERGVRVVEFRTTAGLEFGVLVDRAFDIAWCRYRGRSLAWLSPTGFVAPWYREVEGLGFLRTFGGGLLVTCGLDHVFGPEDDPNDTYGYPARDGTRYGLHGRASTLPGTLRGYGETWDGETCRLFVHGEVRQAAVFAENLLLRRAVSTTLDGRSIVVEDVVRNEGSTPAPHMLLYHVNVGAPLLNADSKLVLPTERIAFTNADDPDEHLRFHEPRPGFVEQAFVHEMAAGDDGNVTAALLSGHTADPWGLAVRYPSAALPRFTQWRCLDARTYVTGLEPATTDPGGRGAARERGDLIMLEPGEERSYRLELAVVDGADECEAVKREVASARSS